MGTQYIVFGEDKSDQQVRDYDLEEIVRMQEWVIRPDLDGHLYLFCHPDAKGTCSKLFFVLVAL